MPINMRAWQVHPSRATRLTGMPLLSGVKNQEAWLALSRQAFFVGQDVDRLRSNCANLQVVASPFWVPIHVRPRMLQSQLNLS